MRSSSTIYLAGLALLALAGTPSGCRSQEATSTASTGKPPPDPTLEELRAMSDRELVERPLLAVPREPYWAELVRRGVAALPTLEACLGEQEDVRIAVRCVEAGRFLPADKGGPLLVERLRRSIAGTGPIVGSSEIQVRSQIYFAFARMKYKPAAAYLEELYRGGEREELVRGNLAWAIWELTGRKVGWIDPPLEDPDSHHGLRPPGVVHVPRWDRPPSTVPPSPVPPPTPRADGAQPTDK